MVYRIYRNLNNGKLSIKENKSGLVVGYCDNVLLKDVRPVVSEAGRLRVLRTGDRNVHAFMEGSICHVDKFVSRKERTLHTLKVEARLKEFKYITLMYNPYKYEGFIDAHTIEVVAQTIPFVYIDYTGHIEAFLRRD